MFLYTYLFMYMFYVYTYIICCSLRSFVLLCAAYIPVMFLRMSFSNWTASAFEANGEVVVVW